MAEIKLAFSEIETQITNCRKLIDNVDELTEDLEEAISIFEDQKSPKSMKFIKGELKEYKKLVKNSSLEECSALLDYIEYSIEQFKNNEDELSKGGM